ncbi:MAG: hypothetical protein ABGY96_16620 [bacterium]|nr:hypothetical protein [Gammaproteobacteria bacterium]HIL98176.1 hypothetical protein [Pseudomonadales bacterium]
MSLIARGLEDAGIATVLVSVMPPLSSTARPPRQVIRRLNIGATIGRPNDVDGQRLTLTKMISLIEDASDFGATVKDARE